MREIKFRAWDGKEMSHNTCINHEGKAIKYGYRGADWIEDANAGIPMQYTGLKDKNGKEVYEGDICMVTLDGEEKKIVIEYKNGAYTIEWSGMFFEGVDITTIGWAMEQDFEFEIIGNIYENPMNKR